MNDFNDLKMEPINQLNLFGYEKYFKIFKKLYDKNILPNKIILSGIQGLGKATFAYHFINYILSINEENSYDSFDYKINKLNKSYKLINQNVHPNFFLIDLLNQKQSIDVNQVRNMIRYTNKTTFDKNKKFIIIDNVENLNHHSVNSLLKIIEEPSPNTSYFLISDSAKPVIETLKSRCIEFKISFSKEEKNNIVNKLFQQHTIVNKFKDNNILETYYDSPGNTLNIFNYLNENNIFLENINSDNFIIEFINSFKDNIRHSNFKLLRNFLEISIYRKLEKSKNKKSIFILYSKLIRKIDITLRYNLDLNNLFFEIKKNYLNAK